ncbi:MAG: hypothetical protein GPJ54_18025 [Candidatus Heimdallarchaeota archaeon]|nr:hypothetical protein [Candidatus Heimdallarchaeota archaeon]
MSGYNKLILMYQELIIKLANYILAAEIDNIINELKITFKSGIILYVRYNDFDEYGYQLMFSDRSGDYERFDNYDKNWDVNTSPHHFHLRNKNGVETSPMNGLPEDDAVHLINYLEKIL